MLKGNAAALMNAVKEIYDQHIVVTTEFKNLRDTTSAALTEYKRLNERLIDKLEAKEAEHIKREAEMLARILKLEAQLGAMTQQAMISAVREESKDFVREQLLSPAPISAPRRLPSPGRDGHGED